MSLGGGECRVGRAAAPWDHHRRRGAESSPPSDRHQQTINVGCRRPSIATHSAAQAAGAGRAPRRSISYACRCPRARAALSERCHKSPLTELLKPDRLGGPCCGCQFALQQTSRRAYSITSSARSCIAVDSSTPIALAVLRLMTSSNFTACSTGRSAGFAPLRILAT